MSQSLSDVTEQKVVNLWLVYMIIGTVKIINLMLMPDVKCVNENLEIRGKGRFLFIYF